MRSAARDGVARFAESLALLSLALAVAWFAGRSLVHYVGRVDLYRIARSLERGRDPELAVVARRAEEASRVVAENDCDEPTLKAAVTASAAEIDRRDPAGDFEGWIGSIERNRALLRHAVACSPHNGNFWTRLAFAEGAIASSTGRLMPLILMSSRLAPAEFSVITARFRMWRGAARWLPQTAAAPLERDIHAVLSEAELYDVKRIVGGSAFFAPFLEREMSNLDPERRAEIERLDLGAVPAADRDAAKPVFDLLDAPRR